jgi:hypothetical protein
MQSDTPAASGIYQIACVPTGKIYVGSAVNMKKRWYEHRRALRKGCHRNPYLQNAWAKYGEANFEFSILELAPVEHLTQAEQEWITSSGCIDKDIGFNICETAGSPGGTNLYIWEGFINPEGEEVTIVGLQDYCDRNALDYRSMYRLYTGKSKLKSYKGWTHKNSVRQRDYIKTHCGFIDPRGNEVDPITNLAEFCRQRGLDGTHMLAVARGRICSHRGWTHVNGRKPQGEKTYHGYFNPEGQRITITNLAAFCRANNLHPVKMHHLKSGKIKKHRGWTWRQDTDNDEYI